MSLNGFPEVTGDDALSALTVRPVTPQLADQYGNQTFYGTTDNLDPSGNFPIDSRIVEFIEHGVLNGSFARGPVDPYHDITDINPLPDWTGPVMVGTTGSMTGQWATQSNLPSGHSLDVSMYAGAASDECYFEQIVPIGGSNPIWIGHTVRVGFGAYVSSSASVTLEAQYLDATGATLGSPTTTNSGALSAVFAATGFGNLLTTLRTTDQTARFLRIRLHVLRDGAAASDVGVPLVTFSDVRVAVAAPYLGIRELTGFTFPSDTPTPASGMHAIYADTSHVLRNVGSDGSHLIGADAIAFPATQVASSDANTLDDYEESNSWTPVLAWATPGTSSVSHSVQVGTYTKIGRAVLLTFVVTATVTRGTGSGVFQMSGLPFTPQNVSNSNARFACNFGGYTKANYTWVVANVVPNSTTANFIASGSGQAVAALSGADITDGTVTISGTGFYFV